MPPGSRRPLALPASAARLAKMALIAGAVIALVSCGKQSPTSPPPPPPTPEAAPAPQPSQIDYTGAYTLTITASPCWSSESLPETSRKPVYSADVVQEGGRLKVTLTGADFILQDGRGAGFDGAIATTGKITFNISNFSGAGDWDYLDAAGAYFDIAERLPNASVLLVDGIASAPGASDRISGTLNGTLRITTRTVPPFGPPFDLKCYSTVHGFDMVRR